jgi:hypothetical protein
MAIKRAGIPAIDTSIPMNLRVPLQAIKENIEIASGMRGGGVNGDLNWTRRSVTLGMLIKLGIITEQQARSVWQDP